VEIGNVGLEIADCNRGVAVKKDLFDDQKGLEEAGLEVKDAGGHQGHPPAARVKTAPTDIEVLTPAKLPTIIDNRGRNTLDRVLRSLLPDTKSWDIATGFFEMGGFLVLDSAWRTAQRIRVLFGDETTRRTRRELVASMSGVYNDSIEREKERDDFVALDELNEFREALWSKQILPRVFTKAKFHAKAYLLKTDHPVDYAITGSSNLTRPGLTENVELNVLTTNAEHITALQAWYDELWSQGEAVQEELLRVAEPHLREYTPFQIWAKALEAYCEGREVPLTEWETAQSVMFGILSRYQQDGYRQARCIADRWGGALVCDGVGLGKTYIGLMLLEYHIRKGDRVLLIVPKSARESVWDRDIKRYLYQRYRIAIEEHLQVHNQTDFGREGTVPEDRIEYYREYYPIVIVDEAHHFRTPWANRSKVLRHLLEGEGKRLYMLTATPINNRLLDLYHLVNYLANDRVAYFSSIGIRNLRTHFNKVEKQLEASLAGDGAQHDVQAAAQDADLLRTDHLLKALVIQRSRKYVRESERDSAPLFPERELPQVIDYSLRRVYSAIYDDIRAAFDRRAPLLSFALYNPERFRTKGQADPKLVNRDKQVTGLVRTIILKRLESSYRAFEASFEDLLRKMAAFLNEHDPERWRAWQEEHDEVWEIVTRHQSERWAEDEEGAEPEEDNEFEDIEVRRLEKPHDYDVPKLLDKVVNDMNVLADMLVKVHGHLAPENDDKLKQLVNALAKDPTLEGQKVAVFTEFRDTARYIRRELGRQGVTNLEQMDSTRKLNRDEVIKRFAPYYNCSEDELPRYLGRQIRVLISTDILSEGLNLQDASVIINYDLHWNPVRLMQRIGRVDRRLDPAIERLMGRDGRGVKVRVINFLPPDELNDLLRLWERVTGKLLCISKTLGIEAPLLRPDDEYEALRLLNERYEGEYSVEEELQLEMQRLKHDHPELWSELATYPRRIFSGKKAEGDTSCGLFCCYRFPNLTDPHLPGEARWYFREAASGEIWESDRLKEIADAIRSAPETPRKTEADRDDLRKWRAEIETRVRRHLRDLQAPVGEKAMLVCWMEVC
jgi:superfamily II DNA or RNA helicase